ncbi:peptidoglycan DD-metalloendopeptidase family protein [Oscillibacter sp. MSJ-2]|uniref:Peptidoglycan DD-metalloendopeptidase family protein n=1 Tax=Dysosmobacter acutus TaxID=2841504 RepID=A0ABS6FCA3_9FIRM|nr:M23 family metallopeptidase [Dysosmobacter acutus]MBU5627923.1 peptidoglycan DD-metalloendopeptidase family protein [Dysosmobacter acutus]
MKKRTLRILTAVVCMVLMATTAAAPAMAVTQADIDALKSDASDLSSQKKALQQKLDALADDKTSAIEKKNLLDQQIGKISDEISNVEQQIATYVSLISQTQRELEDAQEKEEAQYELFCKRVRAMEERGTVSYWSVLFDATSFTDLLSSLDFINEIMDSDQRVIDDLKALQEEISAKKADLEQQKADSESAKADLESKKSELNTQRKAADDLVKQIQANESEYQDTLDKIDAEEEAIQAEIVRKSKELAAQQAASGQGTTAALGGYIWPVPSHRITSPMGSRYTGIPGASTNHKGVDIGGVGYTTEVHAAKAGTVIVSQHSSSYGNYVVVSHGSGNTTLYGHMSSLKVSVGQSVAQGDVLGITGSTGISSGPHLHFEITENGSRVNPLNYLTDYVKAW